MSEKIVRISNLDGVVKYILPCGENVDTETLQREVRKYDGKLYRLISIEGLGVVMRVITSQIDDGWRQFHEMLYTLSGTRIIYRVAIPSNAI